MKNMRKSLGQAIVFLRKIERFFEVPLFSSNSLADLVRKRHISGTLAETVDMYTGVLRSFSYSFIPRKGSVVS